jgi:hypothetical protein
MNVDGKDARYLTKDLRGLVQSEELIGLKRGEAIARIGTEVVKIKLQGPLEIPKKHFKKMIIQRSLKQYYKPAHVVRKSLRNRDNRWDRPFDPLTGASGLESEELVYDEF